VSRASRPRVIVARGGGVVDGLRGLCWRDADSLGGEDQASTPRPVATGFNWSAGRVLPGTIFRPWYYYDLRHFEMVCDGLSNVRQSCNILTQEDFEAVSAAQASVSDKDEVRSPNLRARTFSKYRRILDLGYLPAVGSAACNPVEKW
jgi:hypothetical protein